MTTLAKDKLEPLIEAAVAHRNRLLDREQQLDGADRSVTQHAIRHIDRWLAEVAYKHLPPDYWSK